MGKTTLATTLALALNCQGSVPPCNQCSSCRKFVSQAHPDIVIFDDAPETLKIDQIRNLQHDLFLRPHESRYKIAVLSDFERVTPAAANALLKTLEEPPAHAVLILTAQSSTHLLPTIVSRCQIIPLKPMADKVIAEVLQTKWSATPEQAGLLSKLAAGRLGWAVNALTDPDMLSRRRQYLTDLTELMAQSEAFRLAYAQKFIQSRQPLSELLNLWLTWWRDIMLLHTGVTEGVVNVDLLEEGLAEFAGRLTADQITKTVKQIHICLKNLSYNANLRLNLDVLLLKLPSLSAQASDKL